MSGSRHERTQHEGVSASPTQRQQASALEAARGTLINLRFEIERGRIGGDTATELAALIGEHASTLGRHGMPSVKEGLLAILSALELHTPIAEALRPSNPDARKLRGEALEAIANTIEAIDEYELRNGLADEARSIRMEGLHSGKE